MLSKKLEKIRITNVIATSNLKQFVDISKFGDYGWGIYDNEIYGGVCGYVKTPDMHGKVTVFSNGKMISIGANSICDSIKQINTAKFYLLKENLISDVQLNVIIQNIVAILNLNKTLNLQKLYKKLGSLATYNPDTFAGLIFKRKNKPSCLIFGSGKIIIAGAKTEKDIVESSFEVKDLIKGTR